MNRYQRNNSIKIHQVICLFGHYRQFTSIDMTSDTLVIKGFKLIYRMDGIIYLIN
jgi:hypothetical protein